MASLLSATTLGRSAHASICLLRGQHVQFRGDYRQNSVNATTYFGRVFPTLSVHVSRVPGVMVQEAGPVVFDSAICSSIRAAHRSAGRGRIMDPPREGAERDNGRVYFIKH